MLLHLDFASIFAAPNLKHLMWGVQYTALLTLTSWVLAVALGTALSTLVAPDPLVIASGTAFALSELADFAVYTPLQRRRLTLEVVELLL